MSVGENSSVHGVGRKRFVEDPGSLSNRLDHHGKLETWLRWCLAILVMLYVMWWAVGPRHPKVQDGSAVRMEIHLP